MPKRGAAVVALAGVLLLTSCQLLQSPFEYPDDIDLIATERMDSVIEALAQQDADRVRSLFSPQAHAEAQDLDESIDELLELFSQDVAWASFNNAKPAEYRYSEADGQYRKYLAPYCVKFVDETYYQLFAVDYLVNTAEPDLVGFYSLRFESQEGACGYETELVWDPRLEAPGIVLNDGGSP